MNDYHPRKPDREVDLTVRTAVFPFDRPVEAIDGLADLIAPSFHLDLGNVCNLACMYCCLDRSGLYYSTAGNVRRVIERVADIGMKRATLVGGEPTIRKDFSDILDDLRDAGFDDVVLTTNGLMLSYPEFIDDMVDRGVTTVHLSLDDFDPDVLAGLSRNEKAPGQVLKAFINVLGNDGLELFVYSVVTKRNIGHMKDYVRQVHDAMDRSGRTARVVLTGLKPLNRALENRREMLPSCTKTASAVQDALEEAGRLGVTLTYRNIPWCLMRGWEARSLDAYLTEKRLDLETGKELPALRDASYIKGDACAKCAWDAYCLGVHENYVSVKGWDEFEPVRDR